MVYKKPKTRRINENDFIKSYEEMLSEVNKRVRELEIEIAKRDGKIELLKEQAKERSEYE